MIDERELEDIEKAMAHKYIKRTGGPGAYKYWYKLPDGRLVTGADAERELGVTHNDGKHDHLKRLFLAVNRGHISMTKPDIARAVGLGADYDSTKYKIGGKEHRWGNLYRHEMDPNLMKEAIHHDVNSTEYNDHISTHHGARYTGPTPAPADLEDFSAARRRMAKLGLDLREPAPAPAPAYNLEADLVPTGWTRNGKNIVETEINGRKYAVSRDPSTGRYKNWVQNDPSVALISRPAGRLFQWLILRTRSTPSSSLAIGSQLV